MKRILLVGKLNETVKDLNEYLTKHCYVQLSSENPSVLFGMIKVTNPDLILISLIGSYDIDTSIFSHIRKEYADIPVITIGTESEMHDFLKYYDDGQFENLIRPIENRTVYEAICKRLQIEPDDDDEAPEAADMRKKVLIVDDNATTLRAIKGMLDDTYNVSLATSGTKAMVALGVKRPDLILLDYEMPVCDGRQTLEMIRADDELKDIPVIFLTGVNDREHIEAVLKLRPSGYLLKPAIKESLVEAIEKAIRQ